MTGPKGTQQVPQQEKPAFLVLLSLTTLTPSSESKSS